VVGRSVAEMDCGGFSKPPLINRGFFMNKEVLCNYR
jgi:hypothetical protein